VIVMGNRWRTAVAAGALGMGLLAGGLACGSHQNSPAGGQGQRTEIPAPVESGAANLGSGPRTVIPAPAESGPIDGDLAMIASITPAGGPPGTRVILTGPDLDGAVTVCFGPQAAADVRIASSTELNAIVPPGTGKVPVSVITKTGVAAGVSFRYTPSSTVNRTAPPSTACDDGSALPELSP
jgi:hypothetical protein